MHPASTPSNDKEPVPVLWREKPGAGWCEAEIVTRHWPSGAFVFREVGKAFPGVWLGFLDQARIPGRTFDLRHGGREL